jgi:dTDP-4-amino-4,6-dideoxygalactose transaminase
VTTQDAVLADKARVMRAHGSSPKYYHSVIGGNFRIDALQAALLRVKLPELEAWTSRRRENAARYDGAFSASGLDESLLRPPPRRFEGHIYNQYVIRTSRRDELQAHLQAEKIATAIYYPEGSGYPVMRAVALMALRSHMLAAVAFGPCKHGEHTYARLS